VQPAPHAARPGPGRCGPGGRRRGQGELRGREILGDGQVTGIRGREKGAPAITEQARLVIGADGKHSLVAKAVGARAYRTRPPMSIAFYTYWADVPARDGSPAGTGEIYGRPAAPSVSGRPTTAC
jgi:hypothetical protein